MKTKNPYRRPKAGFTIAVVLHLIFILCAGFLTRPPKKKEPDHLFELVSPPSPVPSPEPVAPEPTPPEPEPTPPPPEPKPTPPPPEPKPVPEPPKPEPKRLIRKDPPKPKPKRLESPPILRTRPRPVTQPTRLPKPVQAPKPRINVHLPRPTSPRPITRGPVIKNPPVSPAVKNNYLQQFYSILVQHWNRPREGFSASSQVVLKFTVDHRGRLINYSLVRPSGVAQLDNSIRSALHGMRSRGFNLPPPGGRPGTYEITFKPNG